MNFLDQDVFRPKETLDYLAYGEIKNQVTCNKYGNTNTNYVYLRLSNDTYWVDSSL